MQLLLSLCILVTGAYLAGHIYGFQSCFAELQGDNRIPYYSAMYDGGIEETAYGPLVILIAGGYFFML